MSNASSKLSNNLQILDRKRFVTRCMGNQNLANKLMGKLLDTLPVDKDSLQSAIELSDFCEVSRIAHRLQGTASNICAELMSEAACQVEQAAKDNQLDLVGKNWVFLKGHIDALIRELKLGAKLE
jgi:HPt (histidine-containing phosphotransfer) domain-containing protein